MKKFISLLLVAMLVFALCACGNTPAENGNDSAAKEVKGVTVPEFAVMVNGVKVDQNMMAEYPLYEVKATSTNSAGTESTVTYVGFAMKDVLTAAGLTESYVWLEATADDGYTVTFEGDIAANTTLLAITKDGEQFKGAPWFAPCTSETTGAYLKGCVGILVNTEAGAPEGVSNDVNAADGDKGELGVPDKQDKTDKVKFDAFSFKVNGKEVTNDTLKDLHIYKVAVTTENSKGEKVEAKYTGYVLADVLKACGVENYTTVKAVANDGYENVLTADQAASEFTVVAIEKDKELGEDGTVWVAPCTETSAKSYAKLVVEIVAE